VVAVGEKHCLRAARALGKPLEPTLRRHERVDRYAGTIEPVGRHVDVDARVSRCPVKDAWKDLAHRRTIAPPRLAPGSARPPFGGGSRSTPRACVRTKEMVRLPPTRPPRDQGPIAVTVATGVGTSGRSLACARVRPIGSVSDGADMPVLGHERGHERLALAQPRDRGGAGVDAELRENVLEVAADGSGRDPEPFGDLGVRQAFCDEHHDLVLPSGQRVGRDRRWRIFDRGVTKLRNRCRDPSPERGAAGGGGRGALEGLPPVGSKLVQEVGAHVVHEISSGCRERAASAAWTRPVERRSSGAVGRAHCRC